VPAPRIHYHSPLVFRSIQCAVVVGLLLFGSAESPASAEADVGQPAPALVLKEMGGSTFDLAALHGEVVVINFWATWCAPCRKELPALDAFYKQYHAKGVDLIGVSADRRHDRKEVEQAMQSLSYPVAMLEDAEENGFGEPTTLPETFVVDGNGVVRAKFLPDKQGVTVDRLAAAVEPLLPPQAANTASAPIGSSN
jgi:cytochrome c biogenesis protein CcmG, thiol:disulfide interchange protein DsbE